MPDCDLDSEKRMDYLGHKAALLPNVLAAIERGVKRPMRVLDAFSGTAAVAAALRSRGHEVHANDHLALCGSWARAALHTPSSPFPGRAASSRSPGAGYLDALKELQATRPLEGFVTQHYSPASLAVDGVERQYLTSANAARIDGMRARIEEWRPHLGPGEADLLLSTLVAATMDVSNTAGTYGCYLKHWKASAVRPLRLRPLPIPTDDHTGHTVTTLDAEVVIGEVDADVVYADPPYTKRQYAAYYHLLETLVRDDHPVLTGSTGLRPWQEQASDWCYRRLAPRALDALITKSSAPRVVLSYNEDGQIAHDTVLAVLGAHGDVRVEEIPLRRYRSSRRAHKGALVTERLYTLDRR